MTYAPCKHGESLAGADCRLCIAESNAAFVANDMAARAGRVDHRYLALLNEMADLHARKAADYGRDTDPLANVRASEDIGIPAWKGAFLRALDKVHRIKSYCLNGKLENEGVEDSLMDLAAYAMIALVLFREEQKP